MVKSNFATVEQWLEARQPKKKPEVTPDDESGLFDEYIIYQFDCLEDCGISLSDLLESFITFLRKLSPRQLYRDDPSEIVHLWEESEIADEMSYPSLEKFLATIEETDDSL